MLGIATQVFYAGIELPAILLHHLKSGDWGCDRFLTRVQPTLIKFDRDIANRPPLKRGFSLHLAIKIVRDINGGFNVLWFYGFMGNSQGTDGKFKPLRDRLKKAPLGEARFVVTS